MDAICCLAKWRAIPMIDLDGIFEMDCGLRTGGMLVEHWLRSDASERGLSSVKAQIELAYAADWPLRCGPSEISSIIFWENAVRSSGLRLVTSP